MQSIPSDVFQHVLLPFLQTPETRQDIHNLLHPSPPSVPLRNLKWAAEAIESLAAIRGTCREFWQFVDGVCGYSFAEAAFAVEQGLQRICLQKDLHRHRLRHLHAELLDAVPTVAPSYVSDGCLACGNPLPHCWPMLHMGEPMRQSWTSAGCCSQPCYLAFYAPILKGLAATDVIQFYECAWCQERIVPSGLLGKVAQDTGNPRRPYFCSYACWVGHIEELD
jgi:hypothetical protein